MILETFYNRITEEDLETHFYYKILYKREIYLVLFHRTDPNMKLKI